MANMPVTPIAGIWTRRVSGEGPYPTFELGVTLEDGSELALRTFDFFATAFAYISGAGIREALRRRGEAACT